MFKQFFKDDVVQEATAPVAKEKENKIKEKAEDILRNNGFKIKSVLMTSFGKQIDFAKKYPDEEVKKVLSSFNIKIKDKSIFIIE